MDSQLDCNLQARLPGGPLECAGERESAYLLCARAMLGMGVHGHGSDFDPGGSLQDVCYLTYRCASLSPLLITQAGLSPENPPVPS